MGKVQTSLDVQDIMKPKISLPEEEKVFTVSSAIKKKCAKEKAKEKAINADKVYTRSLFVFAGIALAILFLSFLIKGNLKSSVIHGDYTINDFQRKHVNTDYQAPTRGADVRGHSYQF